jgi:hypothetical protein
LERKTYLKDAIAARKLRIGQPSLFSIDEELGKTNKNSLGELNESNPSNFSGSFSLLSRKGECPICEEN